MRSPLEQSVLGAIRSARLLIAGDRVGVAVSGGGDSVALFRLLDALQRDLGISLLVVHFDHGLRGAESGEDARFVAKLAAARGIESAIEREDVRAAAALHGWNLEDAGRRLRYAFFQRLVTDGRATRIAVAHTADDQAETVLAHMMRGTGPSGLAGIHPSIGPVVRPVLGMRRQDLRAYLEDLGQAWREDSTNQDLLRKRARIREQLVPLLERNFSPQIVDRLSELARLSHEEAAFWTVLVEDRFHSLVRSTDQSHSIAIQDLLSPLEPWLCAAVRPTTSGADLPAFLRPITQRLIRRFYEILRGDRRELSAAHVEQVIRLAVASSSGRHVQLPGGIRVEKRFRELVFSRVSQPQRTATKLVTTSSPNTYQYVVDLPARGKTSVTVPELDTCFLLKVVDWPFAGSETKQGPEALDADLLRPPLILRNWRPGDAYRPRGRQKTRKLKRMFLAGRIPRGKRSHWPVLESAGQVVWTRGMPPAEGFSVREGTRAGVMIEEGRL